MLHCLITEKFAGTTLHKNCLPSKMACSRPTESCGAIQSPRTLRRRLSRCTQSKGRCGFGGRGFRVCVKTPIRLVFVAHAFRRALWNQADAHLKVGATRN